MACGLCPGYFEVWFWNGAVPGTGAWERIGNVDSWSIDANVQEATKKRTSSTNGLAVSFCTSVVDYTASVTVTLCQSNWLFCDILSFDGTNTFGQELGKTRQGWFFFGWGAVDGSGNVSLSNPSLSNATALETWRTNGTPIVDHTDNGTYLYGTVVPPSFGGDNTSTDPSTATFSVNISAGPLMPKCSGEDYAA